MKKGALIVSVNLVFWLCVTSLIDDLRQLNGAIIRENQALTDVIESQRTSIRDLEKQLEELQKDLEREKLKNPYSQEPFKPTYLEVQEIGRALRGTWLEGEEKALYDIEQNNGVNFRFIYAIGSLESGRGQFTPNTNNYYGIKGKSGYRSFKTFSECLYYVGELMQNKIYYNKSIDDISRVYCPPNAGFWSRCVKDFMLEI